MGQESRIIITFDEFFKSSSKSFFEKQGFRVETEVEIFKLPKRLDVLVVKNPNKTLPDDFTLFQYWKKYNLLSFKSEKDMVRITDIWDCFIYFYGFLNLSPNDTFDNTTISLLVNNHPREFLKKFSKFCRELETGVWEIDSNFCKVYLVELHKIDLRGLDRIYLGNFATDKAFLDLLLKTETTPKDSQESKWIDSIQNIIQDRIAAFEKDPEIRRKFMATVYEADITDLVKPHLDKAELRGEQKGKLEGKMETARKMVEEGFSLDQIVRITGLTKEQVRENGIG
jgi:hypothetical protein